MIKHTLKEGNRVRVIAHNGGVQSLYCEKSYLFGKTGIVVGVDPNFADVRIKLEGEEIEYIEEVDYRCLKRIDRTYEEILMELAEKLKGTELHHCIDECGNVTFSAPSDYMGELDVEIEYTADQLAAISAACTEIAANCAAEHGKENA